MDVYQLTADPDVLDYIRRNAPYLPAVVIAYRLGIGTDREHARSIFFARCKKAGIELREEDDTVYIPEVVQRDLDTDKGVPPGFALHHWQRGVTVSLASDIPGVLGARRHYAD